MKHKSENEKSIPVNMERSKRKTKLWIYTDVHPNGVECEPYKQLVGLVDFCNEIYFKHISELCISVTVPNEEVNIVFIEDINSVSHNNIINIIKCLHDESIFMVFIGNNHYEEFVHCYHSIYGEIPHSVYMLSEIGNDKGKAWFQETVQGMFRPYIKNVAFVTGNELFIDLLFGEIMSDDTDVHENVYGNIPITWNGVPKLIQGWVYRVWYKDKVNKAHQMHIPSLKPNESFIRKSVATKNVKNGEIIIYHHIVPSINLDFDTLSDFFDEIFVDLLSDYNIVNMFPVSGRIINFVSEKLDDACSASRITLDEYSNRMTNIIKNYIRLNPPCHIEIAQGEFSSPDLDVTNTILARANTLSFSQIYDLPVIRPYIKKYIKE